MSYCRWSSDDYRCDVYVYEHVDGGWCTHVAGRRHTLTDEQLPDKIPFSSEEIGRWIERSNQVNRLIKGAGYKPIGLSRDGLTFNDPSPGSCADLLESLQVEGYNVPAGVIETLREEDAEGSTAPV